MYTSSIEYFDIDPVLIGGVGGSGTRIVAEILIQSGIFMGLLLNKANDNMQIARKFPIMRDSIQGRETSNKQLIGKLKDIIDWKSNNEKQLIDKTLSQFEKQMYSDYQKSNSMYTGWGWKVPGIYFILKYLASYYPNLKYIHLIRNGLDMAFSKNQNQLSNWGGYYGVNKNNQPLPKAALCYWYAANKKSISDGEALLNKRLLLIKFEELCSNPSEEIAKISDFLNLNKSNLKELEKLVVPPVTIDRYKKYDLTVFNDNDFSKINEFGYEK